MTLIVGFVGIDGIVLATDSRRVYSDRYYDNAQKLYAFTDSIALMWSGGHAGYQEWLIQSYMAKQSLDRNSGRGETLEDLVQSFSRHVKDDYDFYTKSTPRSLLLHPDNRLQFVLAGYTVMKKPQIIHIDSYNPSFPFTPDYASAPPRCIVGVGEIGEYWVNRIESAGLKIEHLSTKALKILAVFIIMETAKASDMVG